MNTTAINNTTTNTLNSGTISNSIMLVTLEAVAKGCHDNQSIIDKVRNDYLNAYFIIDNDHLISNGQSSINKSIQWAIWQLYNTGYLVRKKRGWYDISTTGLDTLQELPWHLKGYLEKELDRVGCLSGKAYSDLYKNDPDCSYGAEIGSQQISLMLNNVEGGGK